MIEWVQDIISQIEIVTIWGIAPIWFVLMILSMLIAAKVSSGNNKMTPLSEIKSSEKNQRSKYIYKRTDIISSAYVTVSIILSMIPIIAVFNARHEAYILGMVNKIETIASMSIGLTTIMITVTVVMVNFDKEYYIAFSIKDVLEKYRFAEVVVINVVSCIAVCISMTTLLDEKINSLYDVIRFMILEESIIFNILGNSYALIILLKIMFSQEKFEFKLLEQLYRIFWLKNIDMEKIKKVEKWNKNSLRDNIEYLIEKYLLCCNKIKIDKVESIGFVTTIGKEYKEYSKKARKKFLLFVVFLFAISGIIDLIFGCIELFKVNVLCMIFLFVLAFSNIDSMKRIFFRVFLDSWGYSIRYKSKEKFVPRVRLGITNKYDKYIKSLNSIVAFYYLLIKKNVEENVYDNSIDILIEWLSSYKQKSTVVYLPLLLIGYFGFVDEKRNKKIKHIYTELNLNKEQKHELCEMMYSNLFYLTHEARTGEEKLAKNIHSYLVWMSK